MGKLGLGDFAFCVAYSFLVEDCCGGGGIVDDHAHEDGFLRGDGLKSQDVRTAVRERAANFSQRSRTIVHANGQFLVNGQDRKSTRLNSSHANISYAVFCLKKKNTK